MTTLNTMLQNWWTTLAGLCGAVAVWLAGIGTKMPTTRDEWFAFWVGFAIAVLGFVGKSATTGSKPS
jgi:hypothetical protein